MIVLRAFIASALLALSGTLSLLADHIIIVHGSFSSESRWFRPGGAFYEALKKSAEAEQSTITPFIWSGGVSPQSIIEGAGALAELIISLPPHIPLKICAHSNGGNVTAYATMLLAALYQTQSSSTTVLHEDIPETLKKPFLEKKLTKNRTYINDIKPHVEQSLQSTFTHLKTLFSQGTRLRRALPDYPIHTACFMGTPINTTAFDIDMSVVYHAINLYSLGDIIQPLVGKQTLPPHERRSNLQALLHHNKEEEAKNPCHKNIRHAYIGQWLLALETIIAQTDNATSGELRSGVITFYSDQPPLFTPGDTEQFLKDHGPQSSEEGCSATAPSSSDEDEDFDWDFSV